MAKQPARKPMKMVVENVLPFILLGIIFSTVVPVWVAVILGSRIAGVNQDDKLDIWSSFFGAVSGKLIWPVASTVILVLMLVLVLGLVFVVWRWRRNRRKQQSRVDETAKLMGKGDDIAPLSAEHAAATAIRLGVTEGIGLPLGVLLGTKRSLWSTWEDLRLHIWGPRVGKTTSQVIPGIMAAPGPVLSTSNKPDVLYATGIPRSKKGRIWCFDPQLIDPKNTPEMPDWYWNPLDSVTDDVKAAELAGHFAKASREPGAKGDSYFDNEGRDLLADFFLAAALDKRPITDVYSWLTRPEDDTPANILELHGWTIQAESVYKIIGITPKQKDGIYGTAKQMASSLKFRGIVKWVTPQTAFNTRRKLNLEEFVRSSDTLYALSREGVGTASALTTALTAFLCDAAEKYALTQRGGRLSVPLYCSLDEAANVCKWAELPNLFSHFGSRGIILDVILQSWSQGVEVWGEQGMSKLFSAATVFTYGGGDREQKLLSDLSALIGDHFRETHSVSNSKTGSSVSTQLTRERIMDVSDLSSLPRGRAVVLASGCRPTLIRTVPWMRTNYADAIANSISTLDPEAEKTIADAIKELNNVEEHMARLEAEEAVAHG